MAVAWPVVRDALVDVVTAALPGVAVYAGRVVTGDSPAAYVMVGWQSTDDDESAGSFSQETPPDGFSARETGSVLLEVAAVTGNTVVPDAYSLASLILSAVQSDPTLGVLIPAVTTSGLSFDVVEEQNNAGATQRLRGEFTYTTDLV